MIKLLIGGSPCTHWSIAQSKNRETKAEGIGWELFENYVIAKEKFKPDFFLYENNWSASKEIKDQIQEELGHELMRINSRLVSAQNRDRFYVFNWEVKQPEDRGILLKDILETGEPINMRSNEKSGCIRATCYKDGIRNIIANSTDLRTGVAEPVRVGDIPNARGEISGSQATRVHDINGKSVTLIANGGGQGAKTGLYAVPVAIGSRTYPRIPDGEPRTKRMEAREDEKANCLTTVTTDSMVALHTPIDYKIQPGCEIKFSEGKMRQGNTKGSKQGTYVYLPDCSKSNTIIAGHASDEMIFHKVDKHFKGFSVYEVKGGMITIKDKTYPIKLKDGYYIIRKLTPVECERLQTMPDGYTAAVSNTQRYKGLGNGWTAEVIIHILQGALKDIPKDEKIVVLSMYDGIGTGRYCLDKMGFKNVEYHAYEIDKYAMKIAMSNYPDIIQHGDAFQVRNSDWRI